MIARFRIATRATGMRRQVFVHVYDDRDELRSMWAKYRERDIDQSTDVAGAVVVLQGFRWPKPDPGPIIVMLLWTEQLTTRTISHEATHAASALFMMDCLPGWDSRARGIFLGEHEPLAYAVGDITSEVVSELYRLRLIT